MKLLAQWENLAEREKLIVIIGGIIVIALLVYSLLIQPFFSALSNLSDQVQSKRDLLSWLQPAAQKIQQFNSKGYQTIKPMTGSLTDVINNSLQTHQLNTFVTQLTTNNDQQVTLIFHSVPFDAAMDWLTSLWLATGIQIKQATLTPLPASGLVSMQLILNSVTSSH